MLRTIKTVLAFLCFFISLPTFADNISNLLNNKNDPVGGNKNGKVTVVEFFDYQCSHCSNMSPVIQNIIKANNNVRVVFKEFPIRGPISEYAARAALAANKQGKYLDINHALMRTRFSLNEDTIAEIAKSAGINISKMKKDMDSQSIVGQLESNLNLARELGLNGTPVFFVGKTNATKLDQLNFILGEVSQSELQEAIDKAAK